MNQPRYAGKVGLFVFIGLLLTLGLLLAFTKGLTFFKPGQGQSRAINASKGLNFA